MQGVFVVSQQEAGYFWMGLVVLNSLLYKKAMKN